jgi:hypothetical protein
MVDLSCVSHENLGGHDADILENATMHLECRRFSENNNTHPDRSSGQILSSPRLRANFGLPAMRPDPCHPDQVEE